MSTKVAASHFRNEASSTMLECVRGTDQLDKIIASVSNSNAGFCRMSLIPALYSYWERCFRICLEQFVSYFSRVGLPLVVASEKTARVVIQLAIQKELKKLDVSSFNDLLSRTNIKIEEMIRLFSWISQHRKVYFVSPSECVNTESNVGFDVLQKNFERLGLTVDGLKERMSLRPDPNGKPWILFNELNNLVNLRNKIAHGEILKPLSGQEWTRHKNFACDLMYEFVEDLHDAFVTPHRLLSKQFQPK